MPVDCKGCKHRAPVAGSMHSECKHPDAISDKPLLGLMSLFGGNAPKMPDGDSCRRMGVTLERHGVDRGWAAFPFNFDPVWLNSCEKREAIDE